MNSIEQKVFFNSLLTLNNELYEFIKHFIYKYHKNLRYF